VFESNHPVLQIKHPCNDIKERQANVPVLLESINTRIHTLNKERW